MVADGSELPTVSKCTKKNKFRVKEWREKKKKRKKETARTVSEKTWIKLWWGGLKY